MRSKKPRALVIRIGALGDVLLTRRLTYSLSLDGFQSTLLAPGRHASLLLADPWIEDVLDSDSARYSRAFAGVWPEGERRFDLAVVISRSEDLASACESAAARVNVVPPTPPRDDQSIAWQWAESVCSTFRGHLPALPTLSPAEGIEGATLVHPGSGSPAKNWPLHRFVELSRRLKEQGHRVVWVQGPAEAFLSLDAWDGERLDQPSLETLAASLARCRLFIGNDSGVSHLAAAVGAPTVSIFGPTNAKVWRPDGLRVEIMAAPAGSLEAIGVEEVLTACLRMAKLGDNAAKNS